MKYQKRKIFITYLIVAVAAMTFYNFFGYYIDHVTILPVNTWFIIPFIFLLLSIAVMPFINKHWWEENYPGLAFTLGFIVVIYYAVGLNNVPRLFQTSYEYVSFISLIGSLFIVSGGIHIKIKGKSTALGNTALLAIGAVMANIFGTTGASMLLIRPYLRINKYRIKAYHIVFFIFIVSNIGGALTPIGDPPLFLGYLKGIPFFWVITHVSVIWAITVGLVLLIFFSIDEYHFRKVSEKKQTSIHEVEEPEVTGLHNIVFLLIILGAVFIEHPAPLMLREVIMWGAAIASYITTKKEIHQKNEFNFLPIKEVAILFAGIFATMIPALDWLELNAARIGIVTTGQFYWGTGILSSVLDNAPTYLNFLTASFGLHGANVNDAQHMSLMLGLTTPAMFGLANPLIPKAIEITAHTWKYVQAVSVSSVFFGAMTYIGNGPNFMVKSISEHASIKCPTFFGYVFKYSFPILLPIYILIWLLFFNF